MPEKTIKQFDLAIKDCQSLFIKKMNDYGTAWRVMRPSSITDQIYIKINRIKTLQTTNVQMIDESEQESFIAIVNYAVIGLIQLEEGTVNSIENQPQKVTNLYDLYTQNARQLMISKNHDYGEAWRNMRISSITDLIYQKVLRIKQIEDNQGNTQVSEGINSNYYDILIYAIFCLIKLNK